MARQLKPRRGDRGHWYAESQRLAATRQLAQQNPQQKIIVLTITDSDQVIRELSTPVLAALF